MTTSLVAPALAALIAERVARQRRSLEETVESYEKWLASYRAKLDKVDEEVTAEVAATYRAKHLLEAAGFEVHNPWGLVMEVYTTEARLKEVYAAIGRLDGRSVSKDIEDARKKLVRVTIQSAHYPNVRVIYEKKLKKTDPCRIQTVREKATVRKVLVCSR